MEDLIELVRRETCLYDTSHLEYSKKSLKDYLWNNIANELNYKDGREAKEAWLKLRNCHRDAIRRRNKVNTSTETIITKPWKYEKQMEFLIPYMNTRAPDTASIDSSSQEYDLSLTENVIDYPEIQFVVTPQTDAFGLEGFSCIPQTTTSTNHFIEVKERAEKRPHEQDSDDDLQQFFNTMYTVTKKMPALSQHKIKRKIFNLVSDEEELLLTKKSVTKFEPASPNAFCSDQD